MRRCRCIILSVALFGADFVSDAQVTYTVTTTADDFLATGASGGTNLSQNNYGRAGALFVAPASSAKGEFQSLMRFNLAGATDLFNTAYGSNLWTISGITLTLTGNFSTDGKQPDNAIFPTIHAGTFVIEWLSDDDWTEGTGTPKMQDTNDVSYSWLPQLLSGATSILSTNTFTPPGDNGPLTYTLPLDTNVVAGVLAGGDVNFLLYAADNEIGYLFNSQNFGNGNQPLINVTANPIPPAIQAGYFTNGWFHLTGISAPNAPCQIQAASDLAATNWQTLAILSVDNTGTIQFDDTNATSEVQRFYRLAR